MKGALNFGINYSEVMPSGRVEHSIMESCQISFLPFFIEDNASLWRGLSLFKHSSHELRLYSSGVCTSENIMYFYKEMVHAGTYVHI